MFIPCKERLKKKNDFSKLWKRLSNQNAAYV